MALVPQTCVTAMVSFVFLVSVFVLFVCASGGLNSALYQEHVVDYGPLTTTSYGSTGYMYNYYSTSDISTSGECQTMALRLGLAWGGDKASRRMPVNCFYAIMMGSDFVSGQVYFNSGPPSLSWHIQGCSSIMPCLVSGKAAFPDPSYQPPWYNYTLPVGGSGLSNVPNQAACEALRILFGPSEFGVTAGESYIGPRDLQVVNSITDPKGCFISAMPKVGANDWKSYNMFSYAIAWNTHPNPTQRAEVDVYGFGSPGPRTTATAGTSIHSYVLRISFCFFFALE